MGKRKTRKRSRRSKKGGMGGLTAAEHGAASLCVWYGQKNTKKPENTYRNYKTVNEKGVHENKNGVSCGKLVKNTIYMTAHEGKVGETTYYDIPTFIPEILIDKGMLSIMNTKLVNKNKYDIYMIKYEHKCKHGGQRYELFKLSNATFIKNGNNFTIINEKKEPIDFKDDGNGTYDVTIHALMGSWPLQKSTDIHYSGTPPETFLFVPVSGGGKKRRKRRRRRSTKKRRRKSKRRRTKKRRRRR